MNARATAAVRLLAGDKEPVRFKTTGNHPLAGLAAVNTDGVTPVAGNRALVSEQDDATQNGIYTASEGVWQRAPDSNTSRLLIGGMKVHIQEGDEHANAVWRLSSNRPNVGTDAITFELFLNTAILDQINAAREALVAEMDAIIATAMGAGKATQAEAEAGVSNVGWMTPLRTSQAFSVLIADQGGEAIFQQDGPGTVERTVVQVLKEWHTLQMYGGGPDKTAAQNAAAFVAARNKLRTGGTLTVTRGVHVCDPVAFTVPDGGYTQSLTIEGVGSPGGPANPNSVIIFSGNGSGKFWDFDAPAGTSNGGALCTVRNLYIYANDPAFTGTLVSSTTPVTDASKITSNFVLENCTLAQAGGGVGGTLLDIGKTIITTVINNRFGGGTCQIKGQQGQIPAGVTQARQSTTVDLRKNTFIGCGGYPILYGGEGWGLYDNVFEPTKDGRGRAFFTTSDYPIRGMTWINNWFGDFGPGNPVGDQLILVYGEGFVFTGNYVGGAYQGSGPGWNAIFMDGLKGFTITGNSFDYCSAAITSGGALANPKYGVIEGNKLNSGVIFSGTVDASVRIENNGI